jgi:hypothetical protein
MQSEAQRSRRRGEGRQDMWCGMMRYSAVQCDPLRSGTGGHVRCALPGRRVGGLSPTPSQRCGRQPLPPSLLRFGPLNPPRFRGFHLPTHLAPRTAATSPQAAALLRAALARGRERPYLHVPDEEPYGALPGERRRRLPHVIRPGGGEEQRLTVRGRRASNRRDLLLKAHVKHSVRLVQYEVRHLEGPYGREEAVGYRYLGPRGAAPATFTHPTSTQANTCSAA